MSASQQFASTSTQQYASNWSQRRIPQTQQDQHLRTSKGHQRMTRRDRTASSSIWRDKKTVWKAPCRPYVALTHDFERLKLHWRRRTKSWNVKRTLLSFTFMPGDVRTANEPYASAKGQLKRRRRDLQTSDLHPQDTNEKTQQNATSCGGR
jgi:hypothetical protein